MIKGQLSYKCGTKQYRNPAAVISDLQIVDLFGHAHPENFDGLVDSGADQSAVPLHVCNELKLKVARYQKVYGFDHVTKTLPIYWVHIRAMGLDDIPVKVLGVRERETVLLGRDFLKKMLLVIDTGSSNWGIGVSTYWRTLRLKIAGVV